ncbi:MAG TPA: hypothetical protein VIT88_00515 [Pyrinomonadaceae bacterium]
MLIRSVLVVVTLLFLNNSVSRVDQARQTPRREYLQETSEADCNQSIAEQNSLMVRAEKENFTVRRVEFLGLTNTPDQVVRNRMTPFVNEGDIFSRRKFIKSLQNMSKLKRTIYPVGMKDVVFGLKESQVVDMLICFRERRR